jgi:hypothetical protein
LSLLEQPWETQKGRLAPGPPEKQSELQYSHAVLAGVHALAVLEVQVVDRRAWEKQVLSARGFKRVGRHSEYAI